MQKLYFVKTANSIFVKNVVKRFTIRAKGPSTHGTLLPTKPYKPGLYILYAKMCSIIMGSSTMGPC